MLNYLLNDPKIDPNWKDFKGDSCITVEYTHGCLSSQALRILLSKNASVDLSRKKFVERLEQITKGNYAIWKILADFGIVNHQLLLSFFAKIEPSAATENEQNELFLFLLRHDRSKW